MSWMIAERNEDIVFLQKYIRENPSDAWAQSRLGAAYHEAGFPEAAVARLRRAIALVPDFPLPYGQLACVSRSQGNSHLARIYQEKAEELMVKAKARAEMWRLSIAPWKTDPGKPPLLTGSATGPDQSNCPITPA